MEVVREGCEQELTEHVNSIDTTGSIKFTYLKKGDTFIFTDISYYLNYSYSTNFNMHEPDLQWAKSNEEGIFTRKI